MEKFMTDKLTTSLDELIEVVTRSKEYKTCLELKKKMQKNLELIDLIEKLKAKQKQYVKSFFQDEKIKEELNELEELFKICDLLYQYYDKFNYNIEIEKVLEIKHIISSKIISILEKQKFIICWQQSSFELLIFGKIFK